MARKNAGDLAVGVSFDGSGMQAGLSKLTSAWNAYKAAQESAMSPSAQPGLISSITEQQMAQINKAIELRKRFAAGGSAEFIGPVQIPAREIETEQIRLIDKRIEAVKRAASERANAERAASAMIQQIQAQEAQKFEALQEQKIAVSSRISQAMALQRQQVLADLVAPSGNRITAATSMFAQSAQKATIETKKLWAAQVQAKVASNALAYSLGTGPAGASNAVRNLGNTSEDSLKGIKRFQLGVSNAGYQVQDFFVQVASGQSKMVALAQQLPQFLGPFGMYGALAGAAVSIAAVAYQMSKVGEETEKTKNKFLTMNEAMEENNRLTRERIKLSDEEAARRFAVQDQTNAQEKLNKQLDAQKKKAAEFQKSRSAVINPALGVGPEADQSAVIGSAIRFFFAKRDLENESLNTANAAAEASVKRLDVDKLDREEYEKRLSAQRESLKVEEDANRATFERFAAARRENALMEMGNQEQLDYYVERMRFLNEIGAKETEEYEQAKRRAREIGSILLGKSGEINNKNAIAAEMADKTILGLQSRIPQALQVNAGASALGGVAGSGSGTVIDIQRQILEAIRQLVQITRMDVSGLN